MSIVAKNTSTVRELTEAGLHVARCIKMVQLGTQTETIKGQTKQMHKVNLTWELPLLTKVFDEAKGPQPLSISKEFTLSMAPKSNLRKTLESWRGKPFTDEEANSFDITKLLGVACMLNIYHKPKVSDPSVKYDDISSITQVAKGMTCPPQVNPSTELSFDNWDEKLFESLPDFLKDKIKASPEYKAMKTPEQAFIDDKGQPVSDLPWDNVDDSEAPPF